MLKQTAHAEHNFRILASLLSHPSIFLRCDDDGLLQHELRMLPSLSRRFTGDSRVRVMREIERSVDVTLDMLAVAGDVKPDTVTHRHISQSLEALRQCVEPACRGMELISSSHYHGDVSVALVIKRQVSRLETAFGLPPGPPPPPAPDERND